MRMTVAKYADLIKKSRWTVYRMISRGNLPKGAKYVDISGHKFIDMRTSVMTKQELYTQLQITRQINNYTNSGLWKEAFKRYNSEKGTSLKANCGECFDAVKKWLQS